MSRFIKDRNNWQKYTAFKNIFIIYACHFIFIPTHIINFLFFSKKLSIKDMADFPVPTQDVTGDDKQGM